MSNLSFRACSVRCAQLIKDYWASRGYAVSIELPAIIADPDSGVDPGLRLYPIKSDMINGLPRKAAVRRPGGAK